MESNFRKADFDVNSRSLKSYFKEIGMAQVLLVNMPFASVQRPAIGLTQIKSRLKDCFGDRVNTKILDLNMDFARYMGWSFYNSIAETMEHHPTGLGDWLFRQVAFPELPDNTNEYFGRCYPHPTEQNARLRTLIQEKRKGLEAVLEGMIDTYHIDQGDIVGFSSTFAQNVACIAMARLLKRRRPDVLIVVGGANCETSMGREIAKNVEVMDFVFSGPALVSFPRFVQHYLNGELEAAHAIPGVFSRQNQKNGALAIVGQQSIAPVGEELDINTRIELDYTEFLAKFTKSFPDSQAKPSLLFETSRGCWWGEKAHCTFCGLNGETMSFRTMKPELAIDMIESLFRQGDARARYSSVDNIMPRHYVQEVFSKITPPDNTVLFYEVKADLNASDLAILAKAGVRLIQPGIESLATSTLKLMKKGTTATQNVQFLRNCLMSGVTPGWNLLVGFPGEADDVYRKYCVDLPLLTHLFPPSGVYPVRFDRFSPYFDQAKEYKLDLHPMAYYELTYPFEKRSLSNMAYYFIDRNVTASYFVATAKWLGKMRAAVDAWKRGWNAGAQPKLHFTTATGGEIFDSRSGKTVHHDVGWDGRQMLEALYKPKTATMLAQELTDAAIDIKKLEELQAKGLVFREGDRFVGLVCASAPPAQMPYQGA